MMMSPSLPLVPLIAMMILALGTTSMRRITMTGTSTMSWGAMIPLVDAWTSPLTSSSTSFVLSSSSSSTKEQSILMRQRTMTTKRLLTSSSSALSLSATERSTAAASASKMINLHAITLPELEEILLSWGHKKFRAKQVYDWVHVRGVVDVTQMNNIPKVLREQLAEFSSDGSLSLHTELVSKDGTIKRAYKLKDGYVIESVLMPYDDGRYTACISSQAGCAQQCVFCATGHGGFQRQLTVDEIFEQVSRFASELAYDDKQQGGGGGGDNNSNNKAKSHGKSKRLSNIVFMGMGEPLHNYHNVVDAVRRIQSELGIGYRRITVSTVGIVPKILKLAKDLPQVRLAVSLHCADDEERTKLLPANKWNGGLDRLMETLRDYVNGHIEMESDAKDARPRRLTLEWALIEGENDTPEQAHALGKLIDKWLSSRRDMVHINVIPLNPTSGFKDGRPSGRLAVNKFCNILQDKYGVTCTPRVRRGIDINAGCGQLSAQVMEEEDRKVKKSQLQIDEVVDEIATVNDESTSTSFASYDIRNDAVMLSDDNDSDLGWDEEFTTNEEMDEATRLINLIKGKTISSLSESSTSTHQR